MHVSERPQMFMILRVSLRESMICRPQRQARASVVTVDLPLRKSLQLPQSYLYFMQIGDHDHAPFEDAMNVRVNKYPQLRQLCWNRPDDAVVDGETALALYERNWRFVDHDAIIPREQKLLDRLVAEYGNGHLLAA